MKISFIFLGKTKDRYLQKGIDDFSERLKHYASHEIRTVKVKKTRWATEDAAVLYENDLINGAVEKDTFRMVLDSSGRQVSSVELADTITGLENRGVKKVSVIIGGPAGLAAEQLERANLVLSLSAMTFTHDMARLIIMEQIYRAYTIKNGEKYHK